MRWRTISEVSSAATDGTPVILTLQKIQPQFVSVGYGSTKEGLHPPVFPVVRQPRNRRAIHALDLLKAEPVKPEAPCSRPLVGHSDEERFGIGRGSESDSNTISFVSCFSFVSKEWNSKGPQLTGRTN